MEYPVAADVEVSLAGWYYFVVGGWYLKGFFCYSLDADCCCAGSSKVLAGSGSKLAGGVSLCVAASNLAAAFNVCSQFESWCLTWLPQR